MKLDLKRLATVLQQLEWELEHTWGLRNMSGGFVKLDYVSHDEEYIYLTCKSGVQNDVDNDVVYEDFKMNFDFKLL
jgi:hypothetical protein